MALLQLCVSQAENNAAYIFRLTNTKVFSIEEALFHSYFNWKQMADELFAPEFIEWVRNDLLLPGIADKLSGYSSLPFSDRLMGYLRVIDYFDDMEILNLNKELSIWEKRVEWEKLKDQGDYLVRRGMPKKAVTVYKKALMEGRRVNLLNNLAIALMHIERYADSVGLFEEAIRQEPANNTLKLNYAEACIYANNPWKAQEILEGMPPSESVYRLLGELYSKAGNNEYALQNLASAANLKGSAEHIYRLADFYILNAEYGDAFTTLDRVAHPTAYTAIKRAEIYKARLDLASASRVLEKALKSWPDDAGLWLELSECSRRNKDPERAAQASAKALSLQPDSARAKMEAIKVKRAQNRPREYQEALRQLIDSLKNEYRDTEEVI